MKLLSFTILGILNALLGDKYKVLVAILGAECANEEDNAVFNWYFRYSDSVE